MDWLRNNSFVIGLNRQQARALLPTEEDCDPTACYDSFKEHWQQVYKIVLRSQQLPSHDDVLGVVNHLEQMVTLLLYDIKKVEHNLLPISTASLCLEHLISENILHKLFEWGIRTGKYSNAVRLEQLKLYEMLISQSRHLLLVHEPFLRPLIKLLQSCQSNVFPKDLEKHLVGLLYQLSVLLMQNADLLDLFLLKHSTNNSKFIIFSLLIPYLHRDDSIGMQARDALLLCMSLSKKNKSVGVYISDHSNICVLLASGLSGLYSVLPRVLTDVVVPDWHCLTPDDVNDIKDLSLFVTSLEFSNAIAQVAHPMVRRQLQEFLYRGFLIPVLGPALLQTSVAEKIAATVYLELILRTVTQPGLLYPMLQFLLQQQYDGQRLLDILIERINSESHLSLVTVALFETMVDINCEDLMLELVFQHLQPCLHLMLSQRRKLLPLDPHCHSFEKLLLLSPSCCENNKLSPKVDVKHIYWNNNSNQQSLFGNYHAYLNDARNKIASCQVACSHWSNNYAGCDGKIQDSNLSAGSTNSLPSLGESSGYESLKVKLDEPLDPSLLVPIWQTSQANLQETNDKHCTLNGHMTETNEQINLSCSAGPFLTTVLGKLNAMMSNSLYTNLHLTGLISRLAVYSQPLLRTYLLDHSLVLQPDVPSLFQIIGFLKQRIDEFMSQQTESINLIQEAKTFMLEREIRLINARKNALESRNSITSVISNNESSEPFQRNERKRRSFTFSSMFGKRPSQAEPGILLVTPTEEAAQNYIYPKFSDSQHIALCAVLLDEWVKELAALAQEHTIAQLAALLK